MAEGTATHQWLPMRDGVRLSATLYLPDGAGPERPTPCLLEALPYRKDDLTSSYRPEYVELRDTYGYAVCRLDLRGHRLLRGRRHRRVPAAGAGGPGRRHRVRWPSSPGAPGRGDVRHVVQRVQRAADGGRATPRPQGRLRDLRLGRPVRRRRPLHRRPAEVARPRRLLPLHDADERPAPDSGDLGRRLARGVGAPVRDVRAVVADLDGAPALGLLLGPGHDPPGVRPDQLPDDDRRRLGRRLPQQHLPHHRGSRPGRRAAPAAGRPVGPHVGVLLAARSAHRPGPGDGPLVGPAPPGRRHRAGPRAGSHLVRARVDPPRARPGHPRRVLALRRLAVQHRCPAGVFAGQATAVRRRARHRDGRLDLLRRAPALRPAVGPAGR